MNACSVAEALVSGCKITPVPACYASNKHARSVVKVLCNSYTLQSQSSFDQTLKVSALDTEVRRLPLILA
ncbi:hypothetical protein RvY_08038 [Ramazzottius varieornatus]|uniref:Uncharacterized protein n=1 Tax=Ramazzottius varieornatus TaxID=947166 RepID=A0A1D1V968_RAMVA|nr:hypothetical protein RvY_08038 [Ramazzottius varieornatus]